MVSTPDQRYNHSLQSVALNYPSPIMRARTITHNKAGGMGLGPHEGNYCYLCDPLQELMCVWTIDATETPPLEGSSAIIDIFNIRWWALTSSGTTY
jgi:hypothetical protein